MRIAIVIDQLSVGGTEVQTSRIAAALARAGHEVSLLSLRPFGPESAGRVADMDAAGVAVSSVEQAGGARAATRLRSWLRDIGPDVVYAAMTRSTILCAAPFILPAGTPLIVARRYMANDLPRSRAIAWADRYSARKARLIVSNSTQAARASADLEGVPLSSYRVVFNCLPDDAYETVPPADVQSSAPVIVSVASLQRVKDHEGLVQALGLLKGMGIQTCGVFVGEGDQRESIVASGSRNGLDIQLPGLIQDPRPYLSRATVFVQSSTTEGMSNSLLEAMAAGCTIVATDVGGTAEALGDAGILVPPGDPMQMAYALKSVLEDEDLARDLGRRAAQAARQFSLDSCLSQFEAIFAECLARPRSVA